MSSVLNPLWMRFWSLVHFTNTGFYHIAVAWMHLLQVHPPPPFFFPSVCILCKEVKKSENFTRTMSHSSWYSLGWTGLYGWKQGCVYWTEPNPQVFPYLSFAHFLLHEGYLLCSGSCLPCTTQYYLWIKTLRKLVNLNFFGISFGNKIG